jgi:hypothetical protein
VQPEPGAWIPEPGTGVRPGLSSTPAAPWGELRYDPGMPRDAVLYLWLVLSFAVLVTAHVMLAIGLLFRHPRWRGLVSFVVPPLAAYWGYTSGLRGRTLLWAIGLGAYGVAWVATYAAGR